MEHLGGAGDALGQGGGAAHAHRGGRSVLERMDLSRRGALLLDQREQGRLGHHLRDRVDAGGDDGDAHLALQLLVEGRAEDDVGVGIDLVTDAVGRLIHFEERHVHAAGDVDQDAPRPLHRDVLEQRIVDGGLGGLHRALLAGGFAGAHHRLAHLAHHRANVSEVEIDQAGHDHQVGDAAHAGIEHVVGHLEGVGEGGLFRGDTEQVLVRDDDQGVDILRQFLDAGFRQTHAVLALEMEGLGHHADGQDAMLARGLGDDGRGTRAGAAAHAGGDEHHVGAAQLLDDLFHGLFGGGAADVGTGAGAQALGDLVAELDAAIGARLRHRLRIGIGDDELNALQMRLDHVVDRIAAGTADANHRDLRRQAGASGLKSDHRYTSALET